ncbi:nuclear transcription factor Y subunit beta-like [Trichogramma pretiosum]|uniref:nuclear transcription factor Y subunit beta-like n=1 Tax=Trichogramma pretiosum TaxID=7493 RepID=UPI0006C9525F|nr:nuclear transcription factor Y subunit beta-like [Trichogramma pretiosum]
MQSYAFASLCYMKSSTIFLLLAITAAEARNCGDPYHKIDQVIERVPKPPPPQQKPWSSGDSSLEDDGGKVSNEVNDKPAPPPQRAGQRSSGGGKNSAPGEDYIMKGDPHALDEINKQMDEMRKMDYDDDDDVHEVARPETVVQKEPQPPPPPPKQQQEWQQQPQKQQQQQPPQQQSEKQPQQQQSYVIGIPIILPMFNMQFPPPGSKQQQTAIIKIEYGRSKRDSLHSFW